MDYRNVALKRERRIGYSCGYRAALVEAMALIEHRGLDPDAALEACYEHQREVLRKWAAEDPRQELEVPAVEAIGW